MSLNKTISNIFKHPNAFLIFSLCTLTIIWAIVTFWGFQIPAQGDWDAFLSLAETQRLTILNFKQFPLWNPYFGGGIPGLANPYSSFLSPFFIFVIIFGSIKGTLAMYIIKSLIAVLGMYYLLQYFKINNILSAILALLILNLQNITILVGIPTNTHFYPFIFLFFLRSKDNFKYVYWTAILLAVCYFESHFYQHAMLYILLFFYGFLHLLVKKNAVLLKNFFLITFYSVLLSAIKLLPSLELAQKFPRIIAYNYPYFNLNNFGNIVQYYKMLMLSPAFLSKTPYWWEYVFTIGLYNYGIIISSLLIISILFASPFKIRRNIVSECDILKWE